MAGWHRLASGLGSSPHGHQVDFDHLAIAEPESHTRSTALEEGIMTATYTFDVFPALDGYEAASGKLTGYWGGQGPELLDHRLALFGAEQDGLGGQHVSGIRADAGLEHLGVRSA